jgi:hypothetical protein
MPKEIGHDLLKAPVPAPTSTNNIASVAYALDESASEENTASALAFDNL